MDFNVTYVTNVLHDELSCLAQNEGQEHKRSNNNIKICLSALYLAYALKYMYYTLWSEDFCVAHFR